MREAKPGKDDSVVCEPCDISNAVSDTIGLIDEITDLGVKDQCNALLCDLIHKRRTPADVKDAIISAYADFMSKKAADEGLVERD